MSWITIADGLELSLTYPKVDGLCYRQLAHHIAQIVRFNGAACRPYSVAEHSLLVLHIAEKHLNLDVHGQFASLCHDLHEGITGDQATPTKAEIGQGWHAFETKFEHMVAVHLQMLTARFANSTAIIVADRMALAMEREQLLPKVQPNGYPSTPWPSLAKVPVLTDIDLMDRDRVAMTWQDWREMFIEHYQALDFGRREPKAVAATPEAA